MSRYDRFGVEDTASTLSTEHLRAMKQFTTEYSGQLREAEENIAGGVSEVWDCDRDPIGLLTQPYEAKKIQDLFSSDNKPFDKVMTVFAFLCWEVHELRQIAVEKFFAPLSLFGEVPDEDEDAVCTLLRGHFLWTQVFGLPRSRGVLVQAEPSDSDFFLQVGRLMSTLQDLKNFLKRCNDVGKNMMQQVRTPPPPPN